MLNAAELEVSPGGVQFKPHGAEQVDIDSLWFLPGALGGGRPWVRSTRVRVGGLGVTGICCFRWIKGLISRVEKLGGS